LQQKKSFSLLSASSLPLHGQEQKVIYNPSGLVKKQKDQIWYNIKQKGSTAIHLNMFKIQACLIVVRLLVVRQ
jgi:hypothetical protein